MSNSKRKMGGYAPILARSLGVWRGGRRGAVWRPSPRGLGGARGVEHGRDLLHEGGDAGPDGV